MKLSEEQKELYVKSDAAKCPHCGSDALFLVSVLQNRGNTIMIEVGCTECNEHWQEVYELKTIQDIETTECTDFEVDLSYN